MKVTYTHEGWFYGAPVWISDIDGECRLRGKFIGCDFWVENVAPLIQRLQAIVCHLRGEHDNPHASHWAFHVRQLKTPRVFEEADE